MNEGEKDCSTCVQIKSLKDVIQLQKETVDKILDGVVKDTEDSKKDRRDLKVNQTETATKLDSVDEKVDNLKDTMGEVAESIKDYHLTTTQRFNDIDKDAKENAKKWKWTIIGAVFTIITGVTISVILMIMTYLKELQLK